MAEWKKFIPTSDGLKKAANNVLGFPLSKRGAEGFDLVGNLVAEVGPYLVLGIVGLSRLVNHQISPLEGVATVLPPFIAKAIVVEATHPSPSIYGETLDPEETLPEEFLTRLETRLRSSAGPDVASRILSNLRDRPRH
jgi:hypothetical protein